MITFDAIAVDILEVDGETVTIKRKDGYLFNEGRQLKIVPVTVLMDTERGAEIDEKLRALRSKQQIENYKQL